jgi:hypothetical protein
MNYQYSNKDDAKIIMLNEKKPVKKELTCLILLIYIFQMQINL